MRIQIGSIEIGKGETQRAPDRLRHLLSVQRWLYLLQRVRVGIFDNIRLTLLRQRGQKMFDSLPKDTKSLLKTNYLNCLRLISYL
jgi:hypothetical protein